MRCAWCGTRLPGMAESHGICDHCREELTMEGWRRIRMAETLVRYPGCGAALYCSAQPAAEDLEEDRISRAVYYCPARSRRSSRT